MQKSQRTLSMAALMLTYMIFAMLLNSVATVILQSTLSFGIGKREIATLDGFKDVPIALTSLLMASCLPRMGYRRTLMLGLSLVALACISVPLLPGLATIRLMFVMIGITFALIKVSVYASIGLLTKSSKQHASFTSLIEGMFMVGVLATAWVFSMFINAQYPPDLVWLRVYWLLGALAATVALLWLWVPLDESRAYAATSQPSPSQSFFAMLTLLRYGLVTTFVASAFIYVLLEQAVQTWLPMFNSEVLKLPVNISVQLASAYAGALAAGRLCASWLLRYIAWPRLLTYCICAAALLLLFSLRNVDDRSSVTGWHTLPLDALTLPMIGLFMAPIYPSICSAVLSALPHPKHAAMMSLIVVFSALGGTLGSFITGRAFAAAGGRSAFMLTLVPMALLLGCIFLFDRQLRQPV